MRGPWESVRECVGRPPLRTSWSTLLAGTRDLEQWPLARENERPLDHRANPYMRPPHPVPVRTRLTILQDGATDSCGIVFCEAESRSVPVSRCTTCQFAGSHSRESAFGDTVDCALSILPMAGHTAATSFPPTVAAALPVGLALTGKLVCVEDNLPWAVARSVLRGPASSHGVPVVDHGGALVGILPATALVGAECGVPSADVMRAADRAVAAMSVHESESLSDAFTAMTARRARELTVVGDRLQVVGVLRDVDALRFVAHVARTGSRPVPEQAA
jgi:CBS domain-containing protein